MMNIPTGLHLRREYRTCLLYVLCGLEREGVIQHYQNGPENFVPEEILDRYDGGSSSRNKV